MAASETPSKRNDGERVLRMRIHLDGPPSGKWFAVQEGREGLLPAGRQVAGGSHFEFPLRAVTGPDGSINFLGAFAQGPRSDRFVYLNSGTRPHASGEEWERRAKLKLDTIPADLLHRALEKEGSILEARFHGTAKDGGAICASLPEATVAWRVVAAT